MTSEAVEAASGIATGSAAAIALLVKCLEQSVNISHGLYAQTLNDHLSEKDTARNQMPYLVLESVLSFLEDDDRNPEGRPHLRLIRGGLSDQ